MADIEKADYSGLGEFKSNDELIQAWVDANERLALAKYQESELKQRILANLFDERVTEGTENLDLGQGFKLKAVKSMSITVEAAQRDAFNDALDKLETMENGKLIVERLAKFTPTISKTEYKLLSPEMRGIIDDVVTVKAASTKLEFVEPPKAKGKKK